ncbi:hypothetical protein FDB07_01070 [Clostridium botulinum]|nr:hypothetical protein [Clostridium botulinum]
MGENKKINLKAIFSSKKNIAIAIIVLIIICVSGFEYLKYDNNRYQTGQGLTNEQKRGNIEDLVKKEDYEGANILVENYYYYDENKENLHNYTYNIKMCKEKKLKSFDEVDKIKEDNKKALERVNEENIKKEYQDIVNGVNNKERELSRNELIDYINRYMNFSNKYKDRKDYYYGIVGNLVELKKEYCRRNSYIYDKEVIAYDKDMNTIPPKIGMTKAEVMAFTKYIKPSKTNKTTNAHGISEQRVYGNSYLYFDDGKLTSIQN